MTLKDKVFNVLVTDGKQRTAAQLAAQFNTTTATVAARVSEIRDEGYVIHSNRKVDTKGRVKYFYRHGSPTKAMIAAGRFMQKMLG